MENENNYTESEKISGNHQQGECLQNPETPIGNPANINKDIDKLKKIIENIKIKIVNNLCFNDLLNEKIMKI